MASSAPATTLDQPVPAPKRQHSLETNGLITLTPVPLVDGAQELPGEQMVQPDLSPEHRPPSCQPRLDPAQNISLDTSPIDNNSSLLSQAENLSMLHSTLQVDMAHEINKYFQQCASKIKEFEAYKDKFVLVSNHKIKKLIKRGSVEIGEKCQSLVFKGREKARAREIQERRRLVEVERYEIIRKLKTIEQQQIDLVHRSIKYGRNKSVQMKKVHYTAQDKEKVAQILKAKKEFEKSLLQKTDQYVKNSHQLKKMQQEQLKKAQQIQNNRKKQEIAKRLRQMQLKTQERKESLKKPSLKVHHNYIHKQLQRKYKSLQKLAEQQTQNKLKELSMKHKLNIQNINQHDRRYKEHLEKRSQSLSQIKTESQTQTKRYHPTYFGKVIDEQLFEIKERNFQKLKKVKENQYKMKIAKYQEKIDQEHKPKVDPTKSITVISRAYSSVSLTKEERTEKGLEYLAKAKEMKRSISEMVEPPKEVQNYGYKVYKDYLKERESSNIDATEKELNEIMSKKEKKDYSSLLRAKFLAEGLEAKSKKSTDDKLYFSAKTKLSLLSQLY